MRQSSTIIRILKSKFLYLILLGAAMIAVAIVSINGISAQADQNQLEFLQNAIRRSAVQCYALEGRFPDDLLYLEENYTLIVDRSRYIVHYEAMGGNLIPQIWVFPVTR